MLYSLVPRRADLRGFHPKEMARLETQMWRCYYAHNYAGLGWCLYRTCRDEYGFSPADSVRLMIFAARAARFFQDSRNQTESSRALPDLEHYYALIQGRSGMTFNVARAADLELRWWQARRQFATTEEYGRTVAELMGEIYQRQNADLQQAGQLRAQAMAYRDKRGNGKMTNADWRHVRAQLSEAYQLYHRGVHAPAEVRGEEITVTRKFINFRVRGERNLPAKVGVELLVDGRIVRAASATESVDPARAYHWRTWEVSEFAGRTARIRVNGALEVEQLAQSGEPKSPPINAATLFAETYRPQFHFTAQSGWMNDANGLLYYKGTWHLFHQHKPPGSRNIVWGHATSGDLLHWRHQPAAIPSDGTNSNASGSGLVDWDNASGLKRGDDPPILLFFTEMPRAESKATQCLAFSTDGGRTFEKFAGNPLLRTPDSKDRDPKVFFHKPTRAWFMVLSLSRNNTDREHATYGLFRSRDLKSWELLQEIGPGAWYWECPDMFELPVDNDPTRIKWLLMKGGGDYIVGTFDGERFRPETEPIRVQWGGSFYGAQTFNDAPNGRRVHIGWMNSGAKEDRPNAYPGMPFNQQMSFPRELTLRSTPAGPRLFRQPIAEIEKLYAKVHEWKDQSLRPGENPLAGIEHDLLDIEFELELREAKQLELKLRGTTITYDVTKSKLRVFDRSLDLAPVAGKLHLRALLDRTSIELFANHGEVTHAVVFFPDPANRAVAVTIAGGAAHLQRLWVRELRSQYTAEMALTQRRGLFGGPRSVVAALPERTRRSASLQLVVPTNADAFETKAATLLQQWLRPDKPEIVTENKLGDTGGKLVFALGRTRWADKEELAKLWQDGFVIRRKDNIIVIAGGGPRGTLFGAVKFLDRFCGVRFYLPDKRFISVPKQKPVIPAALDIVEEPFVRATSMSGPLAVPGYNDWLLRIAGNTRTGLAGTHQHNMWHAFPPEKFVKRWPEIYPIIKGERYIPKSAADQKWNPCFSEPKLLDAAEETVVEHYHVHPDHLWYSFGIQDSRVVCECPRCAAFIKSRTDRLAACSELFWRFMNALAERLEKKLPGKRIEGLAYSMTRLPPPFKLHRNIVVFTNLHIAEFDKDPFMKPEADGITPLDRWLGVATVYGNHDWHQGNGYLIPRVYSGYWSRFMRHLKSKTPFTYQHAETYPNFGLDGAKSYVLAQTWWNPDVDTAALWRQFCDDMFGPAATPMFNYFATLEKLWTSLDNEEGPERKLNRWSNQFVTTEKDREMIRRCRALLDEARSLARTDAEKKRMELFSKTFRLSECLFEFAAAPSVSAVQIEEAKRHAREAVIPDPLTLYQNMRSMEVIEAAIKGAIGRKPVTE